VLLVRYLTLGSCDCPTDPTVTPLNAQTLWEVSEPKVSIPEFLYSSSPSQKYFREISSGCGWACSGQKSEGAYRWNASTPFQFCWKYSATSRR